jgi:hypothetical protein
MSWITDVVTIIAAAITGYLVYSWWDKSQNPTPAPVTPSPVTAPTTIWNPLEWIVPSGGNDLLQQWTANSQAANINPGNLGSSSASLNANPLDLFGLPGAVSAWETDVTSATGLQW